MQDAFLHEGTRFRPRRSEPGSVHRNPAASGWAKRWRADKQKTDPDGCVVEVASYEEYEALSSR